ncbi:MAG: arsenosugar biosynthesis radical SAM (seleno)protein ArsS [bacterium]
MHDMRPLLAKTNFPPIRRRSIQTLQVNLGYRCNQSCLHCHVNAGPNRQENMDLDTIKDVLSVLKARDIKTLDLTGGAPELNPHFRYLVAEAKELGMHIMDRCNLTILSEPGQETLAEFLAEHQVEVIASLPCYLEENVDSQRGSGVYQASIAGLTQLNSLGYGKDPASPQLNLVYNPVGAFLPPPQNMLETDYREKLAQSGISFNHLYTITNMPIARFGSTLVSKGQFDDYMNTLRGAHQDANVSAVMCRDLVSVDYQGRLYDCDFNQMLTLPLTEAGESRHLRDLLDSGLQDNPIRIADHCYGCTAGSGSSCGGALT